MNGPVPAPAATPSPGPPPLCSRRVRLRPLADRDVGFVYLLSTDPEAGGRVRFGGSTPSPDEVRRSLWNGVLAQFIAESATTGDPLGLVVLSSANHRDGYVYLSAMATPEVQGLGIMVEAVMLTINYAFVTWPFRKLYMEAVDDNLAQFESALARHFVEEGTLRQHAFMFGRYQDLHILAMYREHWAEVEGRYLRILLPRP